MFIRSPYNYDMDAVSRETGLACRDRTRTHQSFKDDSDINVIVKRFGVTGTAPQNVRVPLHGDFTEVGDFRTAMDAIRSAQQSFDAMPASVRARFSNDPQLFLEFCANKENLEEMRKLGLAVPDLKPPAAPPPADPPKP